MTTAVGRKDDGLSQPVVIVCLVVFAVLTRMAAAWIVPDQSNLLVDALAYRKAAAGLAASGQLGSPFMMPLYPLLVAVTGAGLSQLAADMLLSVASVVLVYALAWELFADARIAALSGLATAFYPPLVFFSVVGLSETLFICLALAAFLFWYRKRFVFGSVCAVLAILTRPVFDLAALLLIPFFAVVVHGQSAAAAARHVLVYACIYCALMAPWWLHNYTAYGTFVRLTPSAGTILYIGNNPMNRTGGGNLGRDYDPRLFQAIADPVARDRAMRDAAVDYMIGHPLRVLELAGMKFIRIWRLWPYHEGYSSAVYVVGSALSFGPVALLTLVYLLGWGWSDLRRISPILLFGLYYTGIHMLMVGTMRYRLPLEPFMLIFAAVAIVRLLARYFDNREFL